MFSAKINNKIIPSAVDNFLDNLFDDLIGDNGLFSSENGCEIYRGLDGGYVVDMAISGYKREEILVSIDKNFLKVSRKKEHEGGRKHSFGFIDRQWIVPKDADIDKISAELMDGVLTIKLPLKEEKIEVKIVEIK